MKIFKLFLGALFVVTFIVVSTAFTVNSGTLLPATQWEVDQSHSNIGFQVRHFFTPVSGQFNDYTANIYFDPANLTESQVDVEIQVNSIDTENERRDGHLQSGDFFNAEEYPTITFTSNEIVERPGENNFAAIGTFTIKDVSNEIELPFTLLGVQDHPSQEDVQIAGIQFEYVIDRNEYNVGTGDFVETSTVGGEVTITGALELNSVSSSN